MFKNYFKIAIRNLWKNKTFTTLNILGLTAAFAVAFLLCMYAVFELSFDRFHENVDAVYKVYTDVQTPNGTEASEPQAVPFAEALKNEVPGIKNTVRYLSNGALITYGDNTFGFPAKWIDPSFFQVFSFPVIAGNASNPLPNQSSVVLTRESANTIFGGEQPVGKTVLVQRAGRQLPFTVSAVLEDIPDASSIQFGALFDFKSLPDDFYANNLNDWQAQNHTVFIELEDGVTPGQFEKASISFSAQHYAADIATAMRDGAQPDSNGNFRQLKLLPFADQSFATIDNGRMRVSKTLQYLILGVAFLILFIAGVNFINMSIARSGQRLREIGMRKTLGADKIQIFFQLWGESILVFGVALVFGVVVATGLLKPFRTLFETKAGFNAILNPVSISIIFLIVILVTLISGGYPAWMMSRLKTLQALKGKIQNSGKNHLRNVLLVLQFSITILLISGTLVIWKQLEFLRHKDLGFNKDQVITLPLNTSQNPGDAVNLLRNELSDIPGILSISAADDNLGKGRDGRMASAKLGFDYKNREISTNMLCVDYGYAHTLDIPVVAGRTFDRSFPGDSTAVVINQAMVKELGEENPVGVHFYLYDSVKYSVIGVVKDYNFDDLNKSIAPITFFMDGRFPLHYAYIRVESGDLTASLQKVKEAWQKIEPNTEFLGSYLDENIDRLLKKEQTMITMISSGSILAIVLSCIGLFAISLLVVAQRQKEIGIRKVVGASVATITLLLTKDFLKLIAFGFLIATPVAWYFSAQWLQNYAYRIDLTLWIFLGAGGIALAIALATISVRTIRAALKNPVDSLKTE